MTFTEKSIVYYWKEEAGIPPQPKRSGAPARDMMNGWEEQGDTGMLQEECGYHEM